MSNSPISFNPVNLFLNPGRELTRVGARALGQMNNGNSQAPAPHTDSAHLSVSAPRNNPYESIGSQATRVSVEPWSAENRNGNSSLSGILFNQGYTSEEIYGGSPSLIERVAQTNNLRDPNLIHPGQELVVPSRAKDSEGATEASTGIHSSAAAQASPEATTTQGAQDTGNPSWMERIFDRFGSGNSAARTGSSEAAESTSSTRPSSSSYRLATGGDEDLNAIRFLRDNAGAIGSVSDGGTNSGARAGVESFSDDDLDAVAALANSRHARDWADGEIGTKRLKGDVNANLFSGMAAPFTDRNRAQIAETIDSLMERAPQGLNEQQKKEWVMDLGVAADRLNRSRALKEGIESVDTGNDRMFSGRLFTEVELNEYVRMQTARPY